MTGPPPTGACGAPDCPVPIGLFRDIHAGRRPPPMGMLTDPDRDWCRIYDMRDGYHTPNPGRAGNSRFSPFTSLATNHPVPTLYLAENLEAALLEVLFHDLPTGRNRPSGASNPAVPGAFIKFADINNRGFCVTRPPRQLLLADLRDEQLPALGITRDQLISTNASHYRCTRAVGQLLHDVPSPDGIPYDGIVWHSRQAELHQRAPLETMVVFCDRVPADRDAGWTLTRSLSSHGALTHGPGLMALNMIADDLGVVLDLDPDE